MNSLKKHITKSGVIKAVSAAIAAVALAALMIAINSAVAHDTTLSDNGTAAVRAVVTEVSGGEIVKNENGVYTGSQTIKAKIVSGERKGRIIDANNTADQYSGVICEVGTHIVIATSESNGNTYNFVSGYDRSLAYICLCVLFASVMIIIAGKKGFKALLGLIITIVTLIWMFIPLLCLGASPYLSSVVWAIVTTFITIMLISGFNVKSISAVLATTIGVTVSGVIASVFGMAAHITSFNMNYAEELVLLNSSSPIEINGLLFAGILIASLGAVMDVCMSIASTVNEIHETNPNISKKELFRSGMNVGRDTMGTMANTLILAFAGSSLTMIILLYAYTADMNYFVSMNDIAIEIVQGISGSIGICLCVPAVSFITSNLVFWKKRQKKSKSSV